MLNLTRQERQVILFLIIVALLGTGVNFLVKIYSPIRTIVSFSQNLLKVDLNKSDKDTLKSLSGIGEKLAQRIIEYHKQNGDFKSLEDLKKIKGVTDYRYKKLEELFFVE